MCDQLRRASVSITSNIAEGVNRYSVKDKSHFIEMAYGSLMEVSSQFEIAEEPTNERAESQAAAWAIPSEKEVNEVN